MTLDRATAKHEQVRISLCHSFFCLCTCSYQVDALLKGGADPCLLSSTFMSLTLAIRNCEQLSHTNGKRSRYQTDGEGMTVFDRSRCDKGAGWLDTDEMRSEFRKVCKRLDKAKDEALGANTRSRVQNMIWIYSRTTFSL